MSINASQKVGKKRPSVGCNREASEDPLVTMNLVMIATRLAMKMTRSKIYTILPIVIKPLN